MLKLFTWLVTPVARICACVCFVSENHVLPLPQLPHPIPQEITAIPVAKDSFFSD